MFRNEAGLQVPESGDEVRIGNGKVLYNVSETYVENGTTMVVSQNTQKLSTVETGRLTLVTNVRDVFPTEDADLNEEALQVEQGETAKIVTDHRQTSYGRSILFALNALGKHVFAGKDVKKSTKARRKRAKNARRIAQVEARLNYEARKTVI